MGKWAKIKCLFMLGMAFLYVPVNAAELSNGKQFDLNPVELDNNPVELGAAVPSNSLTSPVLSSNAAPDTPVILTTRPSFTDAWLTVPLGSFQAENGATFADNTDSTRGWILPESLLKLGVTSNTELRFSVPNFNCFRHRRDGVLMNQFGDIAVGISHHRLLPGKIDMAIIPTLNLPTGANPVSSNSLDPQFRVVAAKSTTPRLTLASQIDARWYTNQNAYSKVVLNPTGIAYYTFTKRLSGFLEYGAFIPSEGKSTHYVQGGALYLLTKRQQLDVRMAAGLNKQSSDFLVGFGYSFRVDGLF